MFKYAQLKARGVGEGGGGMMIQSGWIQNVVDSGLAYPITKGNY